MGEKQSDYDQMDRVWNMESLNIFKMTFKTHWKQKKGFPEHLKLVDIKLAILMSATAVLLFGHKEK